MLSTAPLLVEYANRSGMPMSDAMDAMLRMTPPPPFKMMGRAAWVLRYIPLTFTR